MRHARVIHARPRHDEAGVPDREKTIFLHPAEPLGDLDPVTDGTLVLTDILVGGRHRLAQTLTRRCARP